MLQCEQFQIAEWVCRVYWTLKGYRYESLTKNEAFFESDIDFFVRKDCYGDNCVYYIKDGHDEIYDDRGDLFVALRNVAVNIFPNTEFRTANYIYNY